MAEPARGVVIAHSDLAAALVRAVDRIAGASEALVAVSNEGRTPEEVRREVERACSEASGPTVIFTDLASGSCGLAGRFAATGLREAVVVSGANLPMLLDFVFHREMGLDALVERLVHKGREGIAAEPSRAAPARAPGVDRTLED